MACLQTPAPLVAQTMGLGFAMTVDPTGGLQNPSIGATSDHARHDADPGHRPPPHRHRRDLPERATLLPPGGFPEVADILALAIKATTQGFSLAVQISALHRLRPTLQSWARCAGAA